MKDIKNYEGLYAITSCGKVWSYKSKKFLTPRKHSSGYLRVNLYKDGIKIDYYIHRLVADAYISNPNGLLEVNHKDENKHNNSINNLEWCSREYNINYGTRNKKNSDAKSIAVFCLELNKVFRSIKDAANEVGISPVYIGRCCKGKQKTSGGYHWQYAEVE